MIMRQEKSFDKNTEEQNLIFGESSCAPFRKQIENDLERKRSHLNRYNSNNKKISQFIALLKMKKSQSIPKTIQKVFFSIIFSNTLIRMVSVHGHKSKTYGKIADSRYVLRVYGYYLISKYRLCFYVGKGLFILEYEI